MFGCMHGLNHPITCRHSDGNFEEIDSMPETVVHFQIRMPPKIHESLASWAKADKASLNALIVGLLEKALDDHSVPEESKDIEKSDSKSI